jgi:hypothetical protein
MPLLVAILPLTHDWQQHTRERRTEHAPIRLSTKKKTRLSSSFFSLLHRKLTWKKEKENLEEIDDNDNTMKK